MEVGVFEDVAHACFVRRVVGKFRGELLQSEEFSAERYELPDPCFDGVGFACDHVTDVWAGDFTPVS